MRTGPLSLLLTILLFAPLLAAEEVPAAPASATSSAAPTTSSSDSTATAPQATLAESPASDSTAATDGERDSALLSRLRQENQRLKLKLKEAQAQRPDQLLSEQQMWFAVGAGTALLAFIVGRLSGGRRNKRQSQWV
ncbi:hypothetical protein [Aquipseudomonas guryensis]|uniref:Translation initiation factor 2 (IF-2, GTPase) n=1 Tax=Aquipseudomonas guryensis TaxID=2759165 RepID=A0A7W4H359_9GAMM|nr:hypothetical protein [Pseudomonas guryensis]MBB1519175.1 hypothetical protein [Pseudomonas guryensis]